MIGVDERYRDRRGFRTLPAKPGDRPPPEPAREQLTVREDFVVHYVRHAPGGVTVPAGSVLELDATHGEHLLVVSSAELGLERALVSRERFEHPPEQAQSTVDAEWTPEPASATANDAPSGDGTPRPCGSSVPARLTSDSTFSATSSARSPRRSSTASMSRLNSRDRAALVERFLAGEPVELRRLADLKRGLADLGAEDTEAEIDTDRGLVTIRSAP